MNLEQARSTLLVRAVETADRTGIVLPHAIRDRCTADAQPPERGTVGGGPLTQEEEAFVARRADLIETELLHRSPDLVPLAGGLGLGVLPVLAAAAIALAIGFFSPDVWSDRPLHLLKFPLLWLIGWNLLVYLWLLAARLLPRSAGGPPHPLASLVSRWLARMRLPRLPGAAMHGDGDARATVAARAGTQFLRDWMPLQAPLFVAQAKTMLHGGALLLTVGMMAGLLLRGFFHEYLAGWEATWTSFGADDLHDFLAVFLGPASWLTGIAIPSVEDIAALRFVDGAGGGNAQDWILLYVAAAFLYIVVPRAALWLLGRREAARLREDFYTPPAEDRYFHRLLQAGRGAGEVAAVLFHGVEATAGLRARVRDALADELGGRVTFDFLEPVSYGDESAVLQKLSAHDARERLVAVFSLAATPEEEVQGELLRQLAAYGPSAGESPPLVVLDAAPLERFAADGGYRTHYEERLRAWERFIKGHHATHVVLEPKRAASPSSARERDA